MSDIQQQIADIIFDEADAEMLACERAAERIMVIVKEAVFEAESEANWIARCEADERDF